MEPRPARLSEELRDSTAELRAADEKHRFQRALLGGDVDRDTWAAYLRALLRLHAAVEQALPGAARAVPGVARVIRERNRHAAALRADLRALGADPRGGGVATRAAAAAIRRGALACPASLLGFHYVLEGTHNGNAYIAGAVRLALGLRGPAGAASFDPYGEDQPAEWDRYRRDLDAAELTDAQRAEAVAAAARMFGFLHEAMDELWPPRPAVTVLYTPPPPAACAPPDDPARSGSGKSRHRPD